MSDLSRAVDRVLVDHAYVWSIAVGRGRSGCRCGEWFDSVQLWSEHRMEMLAGVFVVTPGSLAAELGLMVRWLWRRLVLRVRPPLGPLALLDELLHAPPVATPTEPATLPHGFACPAEPHNHGSACAVRCPSCEAGHGRHYPPAEQDGQR